MLENWLVRGKVVLSSNRITSFQNSNPNVDSWLDWLNPQNKLTAGFGDSSHILRCKYSAHSPQQSSYTENLMVCELGVDSLRNGVPCSHPIPRSARSEIIFEWFVGVIAWRMLENPITEIIKFSNRWFLWFMLIVWGLKSGSRWGLELAKWAAARWKARVFAT